VMLVMTDRAFNALLSPTFRIGADASIAAGPVGVGAASTVRADIISFARSRGVYAGVSLDGTVIRPDSRANQAFYGSEVSPVDILVRRSATSPAANPLQQSLERMSR